MGKNAADNTEIRAIIDAALRGEVTDALARRAWGLGPEAVLAFMLAARDRIAELSRAVPGPHTPSGAIPPFAKGNTSTKTRRKKPRARKGHEGHRRAAPRSKKPCEHGPPQTYSHPCRPRRLLLAEELRWNGSGRDGRSWIFPGKRSWRRRLIWSRKCGGLRFGRSPRVCGPNAMGHPPLEPVE